MSYVWEGYRVDTYEEGIGGPLVGEEEFFDPYRGGIGTPQFTVPPAPVSPLPGPTSWGPLAGGLLGGLAAIVGVACLAYRWWAKRVQGDSGKLSGFINVYNLYYF